MKKEIDPGHEYELLVLDGKAPTRLRFVKRHDKEHPGWGKYPGNYESWPGTTLQSVMRCLIARLVYLDNQVHCLANRIIIHLLKVCIWLLERRAASRHHRTYWHGLNYASQSPMCPTCGHTGCQCPQNLK